MTRRKGTTVTFHQEAPSRPSSVRILGRPYDIHYAPPSALSNTYMGLCDNSMLTITVEDMLPPMEEADTVFHETLHGICASMRLGLDRDTEERIVSALATGILGVLQDNPAYARWLIEQRSV